MQGDERQLSDRERTVLLLAAEGLTDKEIARNLDLSQRTIATYWERIRLKFGRYSRTQIVARFLRIQSHDSANADYGNLFSSWEEGVWILSPDRRTIYANHRVAHIFGMSPEEFFATPPPDVVRNVPGFDIDHLLQSVSSGPIRIEFSMPVSGMTLYLSMRASAVLDDKGACRAIAVILSDLTLQRRVKHTLESCESALEFIRRNSSDLIARFDANLTCLSLNPAILHVLDLDESRYVGRHISELGAIFRPAEEWERHLARAMSTGDTQEFTSELDALGAPLTTYLLPEPSTEFLPVTVLSITRLGEPTIT